MEKIIKSGFIRIYNKMLNDKSEYRVTPNELYIYCLLFINRRQDESILTSVRMIESTMSEKALISNRQATNRQKIKEALIGLAEKRVLLMTTDINVDDISTDTFFTVDINNQELVKDDTRDTFNGYEELQIDNFKMLKSPQELLIYINSQRFTFDGGFKGSFQRWAKLLEVSRNTAVKLLDDSEERGIISITRGEYIARNQQEINLYFSVDFSEQSEDSSFNDDNKQQNNKVIKFAFGDRKDEVANEQTIHRENEQMENKSFPF